MVQVWFNCESVVIVHSLLETPLFYLHPMFSYSGQSSISSMWIRTVVFLCCRVFVFLVLCMCRPPRFLSSPPSCLSSLQTSFGRSWFRLQCQNQLVFPLIFFFFSVKRGVVCTWTLLYDSYGPPSPPDSIGMQIKCPSPVSAAPPSLLHPTITYMHTLYTLHVACMSRVNTVTFDRLGTSFCSFFCLPSLSIALRYFLSSYCAVVVFVRQLSELLFVSFYLSFLQ